LSNDATGMAAQQEADAIIASLGLDGDGPGKVNDIVSRIEADADGEIEHDDGGANTDTDKGEKPQADSLTATSTDGKGKTATQTDDGNKAAAASGEQPAGVLLKDGKHFLPYDKHVEERRQRVEAENRVKQLEDELAALKAGTSTTDQPGPGDVKPAAATGDIAADLAMVEELEAKAKAYEEEGLTELAASTATQAKVLRSLAQRVQQYGGYVEKLEARDREEQGRAQRSVEEQVAEAIDNNPTLRYLNDMKDKDAALAEVWDEIAAEDQVLRTLPKYAKVSFADRFAAAVKRVEADRGQIKLPAEYQTTAQVKAAAEARTREAGSEFRPNTLTDLPGGGVPPGANDDPFDSMDPSQLERLMDDPRKMNEILSRVG